MKLSERSLLVIALILCLVHQELSFCWSLNDEGFVLLRFRERVKSDPFGALSNWKDADGVENPCTWVGVGCFNGNVVSLDLKDLHLYGTLAPDLAHLVHLKFINLRNNSFTEFVPDEIAKLEKLEILGLGYNNFSQPLPFDLCNNPSLEILTKSGSSPRSSASPSSLLSPAENRSGVEDSRRSHHRALILSAAIGGPILLLILTTGMICFRSNKMAVVKPWATGLSGQL